MNRRAFLTTVSAGSLTFAAGVAAVAAQARRYDIVIKGGRVIDPASGLDAVRDVAVAQGRIASIGANLDPAGADVFDARDKLVVPGLIDIHTHAARDGDGPRMLIEDGVTGWIDAGSQGADHIEDAIAVARQSPQQGRVLINISRIGIATGGENMNLANVDVAAARDAIAKHRDFVVGIKARLSADIAGSNDYEVLRRAEEAARAFNVPVMIHMGQTNSPMSKLQPLLKRGDIVTHFYAPPPNGILDERGQILPEVLAARRRGVWFDVGNGRLGHLRWDMFDSVKAQHFWPDTISTDWNAMSRTNAVIDLPNCMSRMMLGGMSLRDAIASTTVNASRVFPVFKDRGTLKTGAIADIAILELRSGTFEFEDNYGNKRQGTQRLFPAGTILAGARKRG
jgi:dihydroorotase